MRILTEEQRAERRAKILASGCPIIFCDSMLISDLHHHSFLDLKNRLYADMQRYIDDNDFRQYHEEPVFTVTYMPQTDSRQEGIELRWRAGRKTEAIA